MSVPGGGDGAPTRSVPDSIREMIGDGFAARSAGAPRPAPSATPGDEGVEGMQSEGDGSLFTRTERERQAAPPPDSRRAHQAADEGGPSDEPSRRVRVPQTREDRGGLSRREWQRQQGERTNGHAEQPPANPIDRIRAGFQERREEGPAPTRADEGDGTGAPGDGATDDGTGSGAQETGLLTAEQWRAQQEADEAHKQDREAWEADHGKRMERINGYIGTPDKLAELKRQARDRTVPAHEREQARATADLWEERRDFLQDVYLYVQRDVTALWAEDIKSAAHFPGVKAENINPFKEGGVPAVLRHVYDAGVGQATKAYQARVRRLEAENEQYRSQLFAGRREPLQGGRHVPAPGNGRGSGARGPDIEELRRDPMGVIEGGLQRRRERAAGAAGRRP